jgi:outer membrane protein assembly factor BamB
VKPSAILPLAAVAVLCAALRAQDGGDAALLDDWHQWRGPLGTGVAPRGEPPLSWSETRNVRWKVEIPGEGHASPIVWRDRVFTLSAQRTERQADAPPEKDSRAKTDPPKNVHRFLVTALDRKSGKTLWQRVACEAVPHEGRHETNTYASASPLTDGRRVYAFFGSRGLYCYDVDGALQWKRDLGDMRTRSGWGEGASPALHGETLVVNWDQEEGSFIAALDAQSGETRWKADRDEPTSWSTPLVVGHGGRTQVIVNATNRVRSYDIGSGEVIWECGGLTVNAIPSPVAAGGVVFCMSGYRGSAALAIALDSKGDVTGTPKVLWRLERGTPYVPSPLLYGERLYFTQVNNAILTSVDASSGKPVIDRERLPELQGLYASPVGAADRIYFAGRDGVTLVIRRADKLEVLAVNRLDEPIDASPAIAGRQLFIRGRSHIYCLEDAVAGN